MPPVLSEGTGVSQALPSLQEAEAIIQKIRQQQYADLLAHDQLLMERREQKVFLHFGERGRPSPWGPLQAPKHPHSGWGRGCVPGGGGGGNLASPDVRRWSGKLTPGLRWVSEEEEITFAPTYRFERLTRDKYAYTKQKATGVSAPRPLSPPRAPGLFPSGERAGMSILAH